MTGSVGAPAIVKRRAGGRLGKRHSVCRAECSQTAGRSLRALSCLVAGLYHKSLHGHPVGITQSHGGRCPGHTGEESGSCGVIDIVAQCRRINRIAVGIRRGSAPFQNGLAERGAFNRRETCRCRRSPWRRRRLSGLSDLHVVEIKAIGPGRTHTVESDAVYAVGINCEVG